MSENVDNETQVEDQNENASATEADSGEQLDQLMQADPAEVKQQRLEADAVAAAESAVAAASTVIDEFETEVEAAPEPVVTTVMTPGRLWALRGALILNFVLMGVMVALPSEKAAKPEPAPVVEPEPEVPPPFVKPAYDPRLVIPKDELFDESLIAARDGEYDRAAELMQQYIESHPTVHSSLMHGAYVLMERYLRLAGRNDEAVQYGMLARRLVGQTHLPEDLWREAQAAEAAGDPRLMRQAYARLLLQRSMLTPSQLSLVTEAYLKFGDSYRIEAEQGGDNAPPALRDQNSGEHR